MSDRTAAEVYYEAMSSADNGETDPVLMARTNGFITSAAELAASNYRRDYGIEPTRNVNVDLNLSIAPSAPFVRLRSLLRSVGVRPVEGRDNI